MYKSYISLPSSMPQKPSSQGKAQKRGKSQLHAHRPGGAAVPTQLQCKAAQPRRASLMHYDRILRKQCSSPRYSPAGTDSGRQAKNPVVTPK